MITFFNRRELMVVLSSEQLYRIGQALSAANIPYRTAILNQGGIHHTRGRSPFMKTDYMYQYKLYVHRNDYDRAVTAIQPALREP